MTGKTFAAFAHARIDHWLARTRDRAPGGYPATAAMLRALYDIVDRLKTWEEERKIDGPADFARICAALDAEYATLPVPVSRAGAVTEGCPTPVASSEDAERAALRARIADLRARCDASAADAAHWAAEAAQWARDAANRATEASRLGVEASRLGAEVSRLGAEVSRLDGELSATIQRLVQAEQASVAAHRRIEAIEGGTSWRATAAARLLAGRAKRLVRRRDPVG